MSQRNKVFLVVIAAFLAAMLACNSSGQQRPSTPVEPTPTPTVVAELVDDGFVFELGVSVSPALGDTRQCIAINEYIAVKVALDPSPGLSLETGFPEHFNIQLVAYTGDHAIVRMNGGSEQTFAKGEMPPAILDMVGRADWNAPYRFRSNVPLAIYVGSEGDKACFEIQKTNFVITGVKE